MNRTGWLAAVALGLIAVGAWVRSRWPSSDPALRCPPTEVRWVDAGFGEPAVAVCAPDLPASSVLAGPSLTVGAKLDLNRATAEDLALIPNVGPVLSRALVRARGDAGFGSWDEVQGVSGVGPAKLQILQRSTELHR